MSKKEILYCFEELQVATSTAFDNSRQSVEIKRYSSHSYVRRRLVQVLLFLIRMADSVNICADKLVSRQLFDKKLLQLNVQLS